MTDRRQSLGERKKLAEAMAAEPGMAVAARSLSIVVPRQQEADGQVVSAGPSVSRAAVGEVVVGARKAPEGEVAVAFENQLAPEGTADP